MHQDVIEEKYIPLDGVEGSEELIEAQRQEMIKLIEKASSAFIVVEVEEGESGEPEAVATAFGVEGNNLDANVSYAATKYVAARNPDVAQALDHLESLLGAAENDPEQPII